MEQLLKNIDSILRFTIWFVGILVSYRIIYLVIGLFLPSKKFKATDKKHKFAILIAARNEEQTIAQLIDSIKKQCYSQELITTFVIAHNCTDRTAEIAREAGAIVYEYNNKKQRRKGFALNYLLQQIKKDYATAEQPNGILTFDGYFLFDADNLLAADFVTQMNKAFVNPEFDCVAGYLNVKNFGTSVISSYSSVNLYNVNLNILRPLSWLGVSVQMRGTGVLLRSHMLENGYNWFNLTEDNEFSAWMMSRGYRSTYCEAAKHFDEQPLSFRILARQQMRWARGGTLVFLKTLPRLLFGIVAPVRFREKSAVQDNHVIPSAVEESRHCRLVGRDPSTSLGMTTIITQFQKRFSCFDRIMATFPLWVLTMVYGLLYPIAVLGYSAVTGDSTAILQMLITVLPYYTIVYANSFFSNLVTILREGHQMRVVPIKLMLHMFLWPFVFIAITYVWLVGIFWPVKWKPIPHVIDKQIEDIYKEDTLARFR